MSISRNQLRAARVLLCLSQDELATLSNIGIATIRRYESGFEVSQRSARTLRTTVEAAGAVILDSQELNGRRIGDGVALLEESALPPETRRRLNARIEDDHDNTPRKHGRPRKRPLVDRTIETLDEGGAAPPEG